MSIERRAVKKRVLKSGGDRTDTAVYVLLKYGVVSDADQAFKIVTSKDEVLMPSDLSYYNDQVNQDLGMGRSSLDVVKIRNALAEFYGLYEPEEDDAEPDELDDLLGSILSEDLKEPSAPSSSALAIYEGVGEDDIVEEEIDERILNLLKLDGVHDIDYATYMTLLKERMVAGRMADSSMPTEEVELLTDEFRRVKGKVGRFKLRKKRITAEDMGTTGPVTVSDDQFFLASSAVIPSKGVDADQEDDTEILKKLDDILKSLKMEEKEEKKKSKSDKKDREEEKRRKREAKLEAKKRKEFKNLITKVIAPVTSFLEKIINWIKWTFIGFIFNQALAWFKDPANKGKVEALGSFLKAFWPAILAAAALFLTPFGAFVRSTIKLLRWAVPKLLGIIKKHPKLAAAAALIGAGAIIPQMFPGTVNEQERKTAEGAGSNAEKIDILKKQKENLNPLQIIQGVGSEIDEQIKFLETGESASYGAAPGGRVQPGGGGSTNAEMPTIEGMSGGGEVGTVINNYGLYNGGGLVHNNGGAYNNFSTLDSKGAFNPVFTFSGGGITLPNVSVPNMSTDVQLLSGGGNVGRSVFNVNDIRFAGGGGITNNTGVDITGAGPDTQLIAAKPGEIVMSTEAVNHWGANTLLAMNKAGGGTNIPKMANNIQMAAGGGMVGGTTPSNGMAAGGGMVGGTTPSNGMPSSSMASISMPSSPMASIPSMSKSSGSSQKITMSSAFGSKLSMDGPATPDNSSYSSGNTSGNTSTSTPSAKTYKVNGPIIANKSLPVQRASSGQTSSASGGGSVKMPSNTSSNMGGVKMPSNTSSKMGSVKMPSNTSSKMGPVNNNLSKSLTGIKPGILKGGSKVPSLSTINYSPAVKSSSPRIDITVKTTLSGAMSPVKTPVGNTKPNIINLPTKTSVASTPPISGAANPDIPKFSSTRQTAKRNTTLIALGINDLVG